MFIILTSGLAEIGIEFLGAKFEAASETLTYYLLEISLFTVLQLTISMP